MMAVLMFAASRGAPTDMWQLAQQNADTLRFSTLFTAQQVGRLLSTDEDVRKAIEWCRRRGITHVYIESFRNEVSPPTELLERARDAFREAGFLVSGCITPAGYGKRSTGWEMFSCYTAPETRQALREMSRRAAGLFDEVMIDDFYCTDCECPECEKARGGRTWAEFRCELMLELARTHVIGAGREVNPDVRFVLKYPCWHERFQERGYDVVRETELFPAIWVGTETRGVEPGYPPNPRWQAEPQYRAYWLMRWLLGIGGEKCGGGWYDTIGTSPAYYLEQARQTVLGGAREAFLFNFGAIYGGESYDRGLGPKDMEALVAELPLHFELARLIKDRPPRGLLGWKPPSSPPGPDANLHALLGMAGFPVIAAHRFDPVAPGYVCGHHVLHDPDWVAAGQQMWESGHPMLITGATLKQVVAMAGGYAVPESEARRRMVVLPDLTNPNRYDALAGMPQDELDALRDRACSSLGLSFHAPYGVGLYLFGDDVAVVENFRDEAAGCSLAMDGWAGFEPAVQMPAGDRIQVADGSPMEVVLPPRSMLALRRKGRS